MNKLYLSYIFVAIILVSCAVIEITFNKPQEIGGYISSIQDLEGNEVEWSEYSYDNDNWIRFEISVSDIITETESLEFIIYLGGV